MKIRSCDVKKAFDCLINERKSREYIANWAAVLQAADEDDDLIYEPYQKEQTMRFLIDYLSGIDMIDMEGEYVHSKENILDIVAQNTNDL